MMIDICFALRCIALEQRFHPADGYEMTAEKLPHEMFEIGEPMGHATSAARSTVG